MRRFNTAGPCKPEIHYTIPPETRLPEARDLIEGQSYFVLRAPRQTGKTTTLRALAEALTAEGKYAALWFSCEAGEVTGDDFEAAQRAVLSSVRARAEMALPEECQPPTPWPAADATRLLATALAAWVRKSPRPLVLFFDEIDALQGHGLISVLRQLREVYPDRPTAAPWSVVLCGLRDVRDYKAASGGDATRLGTSSPFNIKVKSLRMGDFTFEEVCSLYGQHTAETGQPFTDDALALAFELTAGQPWLVSAPAREVVEEMRIPLAQPITSIEIETAKERIILARQTHLDSLVARLHEPRVKKVIEPVVAGLLPDSSAGYDDDLEYVRDLGLIGLDRPARIANPIYREVVVRVLALDTEAGLVLPSLSFVLPDGRLDFERLLHEFAVFWRLHGEILSSKIGYNEAAPQLVLMAFLQRIVNSDGYIDREYGIGRGRIDLLVRWPYADGSGKKAWQREALELKVWRDKEKDPLAEGLDQLDGYLDKLGLDRGVLVIFDRRSAASPVADRTAFENVKSAKGRDVVLLRA